MFIKKDNLMESGGEINKLKILQPKATLCHTKFPK